MCHTPAKTWVRGHGLWMDGWSKPIIQLTQLIDGVWQLSVKAENDNDYYTKYSDHMNLKGGDRLNAKIIFP